MIQSDETIKKEQEQLKLEGTKKGLNFPLLPTSKEDEEIAKQIQFHNSRKDVKKLETKLTIKSSSIFGNKSEIQEEKRKRLIHILSQSNFQKKAKSNT